MHVDGVDHETLVEAVGDELERSIPTQQRVVGRARRLPPRQHRARRERADVRAILDWEICTLGDPMADLGLLLCLLGRARATRPTSLLGVGADDAPRDSPPATRCSRPTPALGVSTSVDVAYYQAFGYWKLACIMQGVFARYRAGADGG